MVCCKYSVVDFVVGDRDCYYLMSDGKKLCVFDYYEDANFICKLLNKQYEIIGKYEEILSSLAQCMGYCIDVEKDYGDEYVVSVLNDIYGKFRLNEFVK